MFLYPRRSSSSCGFKLKFSKTPHFSFFFSFPTQSLWKDLLLYTLLILHFLCDLDNFPGDIDICYFPLPSDYFPLGLGNSLSIFLWAQSLFFTSFLVVQVGLISPLALVTDMHPTWSMRVRWGDFGCNHWERRAPMYWGGKQSWCARLFSYICQNTLSFLPFSVAMLIYEYLLRTHGHGRKWGVYKRVSYKLIL